MALQGIDIASWQEGINLALVPCDFVIVKATQGTGYVNPCCDSMYQDAKANGKLRGVYHYASGGDPVAEANFFLDNISGYIGDAMLVLDWESGENASWNVCDNWWIKTWCDHVASRTGVKPVVYIQASALHMTYGIGDYGLWVAQYGSMEPTGYQDTPWNEGAYDCMMRQYASSGALPGWGGRLDLNKFYGDSETWWKYANPSGEVKDVVESPVQPRYEAPAVQETQSYTGATYTVQPGDTLSAIAVAYGTDYQTLASINGLADPNKIYPGQVLVVKGGTRNSADNDRTSYVVKPGDTLSGIASQFGTTYQAIALANGISNPNIIYPGQTLVIKSPQTTPDNYVAPSDTYTVHAGDTLSGIAERYGTTYQRLASVNGLADPNMIYPGQVLTIA